MTKKHSPTPCQCPECLIKIHKSDCAVHNEPAFKNGSCDCLTMMTIEEVERYKESTALSALDFQLAESCLKALRIIETAKKHIRDFRIDIMKKNKRKGVNNHDLRPR